MRDLLTTPTKSEAIGAFIERLIYFSCINVIAVSCTGS